MRTTPITLHAVLLVATLAFLAAGTGAAQPTNLNLAGATRQPKRPDMKVSVFFGTTKALSVEEVRTNAMEALRAKGHTVSESSQCVINVVIQGKEPGCAVLFWDFEAKTSYQVLFNGRGEVAGITGGGIQHAGPPPHGPRPKLPEGGVRRSP